MVRIHDLRQYLNGGTVMARAYLTKHVEKIVMDPDGTRHVASGSWNLLGEGSGIVARRWDGAEGQS